MQFTSRSGQLVVFVATLCSSLEDVYSMWGKCLCRFMHAWPCACQIDVMKQHSELRKALYAHHIMSGLRAVI